MAMNRRQTETDPLDGTQSPLRIRIRVPRISPPSVSLDEIRASACRKLQSNNTSLLKSLLLQNALDALDQYSVLGVESSPQPLTDKRPTLQRSQAVSYTEAFEEDWADSFFEASDALDASSSSASTYQLSSPSPRTDALSADNLDIDLDNMDFRRPSMTDDDTEIRLEMHDDPILSVVEHAHSSDSDDSLDSVEEQVTCSTPVSAAHVLCDEQAAKDSEDDQRTSRSFPPKRRHSHHFLEDEAVEMESCKPKRREIISAPASPTQFALHGILSAISAI